MNPNVRSLGSGSAVGEKTKYQISKGENKSVNEVSQSVVWEGERVAPCFPSFFYLFLPLRSLVPDYNVIYFSHLNSCKRTHVLHKLKSLLHKRHLNRLPPSSKNAHFQNKAKCTTSLVKMIFMCMSMRMNNYFHVKG